MPRISDRVRLLVGLENLLLKAKRRLRECERETSSAEAGRVDRYRALVARISDEIHSADRSQLEDYLTYVEQTLIPRIVRRVESTKEEMLGAARQIVDARAHLHELRTEFTDSLERVRSLRERLDLDPFRPLEANFGLGPPPSATDRHARDAHDLIKEYLKS